MESLQQAGESVADAFGQLVELVEDALDDGVVIAGDLVGDLAVVFGHGVVEEWAAGGFAVGEVAHPGRNAGAGSESQDRSVGGAFASSEGVFDSCVNALRLFTDLGLLVADSERGRESGRRVVDRDRFLDAYATASAPLRKPTVVAVGVTWRDTVDGLIGVGARWTTAGVVWAATGAVAASVLAPHLSGFGSADVSDRLAALLGFGRGDRSPSV